MSEPYTHAMHARKCEAAALMGQVLSGQHVQVKKNGVTYCAQIQSAWTTENGGDCWTVVSMEPEVARFTVSTKNVRECGGVDCACAEGAGAGRGALARHEAATAAEAGSK